MNILTEIILLIASPQISDQIDTLGIPYEILPYPMKPFEERPMPADLITKIKNKSDLELAYEDCMDSYSLCRSGLNIRPDNNTEICAIDKASSSKGTFKSICELIYDNCKNNNGSWGYFHDGACTVEFVDDPERPEMNETKTEPPINKNQTIRTDEFPMIEKQIYV